MRYYELYSSLLDLTLLNHNGHSAVHKAKPGDVEWHRLNISP